MAVLLTLGACSSDPEPKEPKRTATSATPTATPPTMPAQAKEDTPEGAAAFVKHYIDVFNYASNTGDVKELSKLSSDTCTTCQNYVSLYRETYRDGGYFKDSDWSIGELDLEVSDQETVIFTDVTSPAGTYRPTDGPTEVPGTPERFKAVIVVKYLENVWQVVELGRRKST
jgi:hypothetical protein